VPAVVAADVVSTLGTEMAAVALPWFVLTTTGSPARMAGVMAAEFAGIAVFGVPAGHVAHRAGSRRALLASDALRAVLIMLIPVLHWAGALHYPVLIAVGLAVGALFPSYTAAQRVVVADAVGADELRLTRVSGLLGAANEGASFAGPALGGVLVAAIGAASVLVVDAASFVVSLGLLLSAVPATAAPSADERERPGAGLRWLRRDPQLRRQVGAVMCGMVSWTALMAVLPVAAHRHYHGGAALVGALLAAYGAGSVVGGLVSARTQRTGSGAARWAMVTLAAACWVLVAVPPVWAVAAAVATVGVCNGLFFPRLFAVMTLRPPPSLRGPVMTAAQATMSSTAPIGFVAAGVILDHWPIRTALLLVAVAASAAALVSVTGEPMTAGVDVERLAADEPGERHPRLVGELHGER